MKIKIETAKGPALDWLVAKARDLPLKLDPMGFRKEAPDSKQAGWWVWDGQFNMVIGHRKIRRGQEDGYSPSTDWHQGGPIIEREKITVEYTGDPDTWCACIMADQEVYGPTFLIAAMRCFICFKLGEEVDVPDELVRG